MSGFIDKSGPYAGPTGAIINNLDEGYKAIQEYYDNGYKQIPSFRELNGRPVAEAFPPAGRISR